VPEKLGLKNLPVVVVMPFVKRGKTQMPLAMNPTIALNWRMKMTPCPGVKNKFGVKFFKKKEIGQK